MKKQHYRKFLPSVLPMDLTRGNTSHIETGFMSDGGNNWTQIDIITELFPGGTQYATMSIVAPHKDTVYITQCNIEEDEAKWLLAKCNNKIKKYRSEVSVGDLKIYVNRYTLGVVTIDIDASQEITHLPDYCGVEVTDDLKYHELYLTHMREEIKRQKISKKKKDANDNNLKEKENEKTISPNGDNDDLTSEPSTNE